jgi:hypothetical protein
LRSNLLLDLAQEGNGTYAFIPVAPNVGTVFVNSIANILSTYTAESSLRLVTQNGGAILGDCLGNYDQSEETWGRFIHLGPLTCG